MTGLKLAMCWFIGLLLTIAIAWSKTSRHPVFDLGISLQSVPQPARPTWLMTLGAPISQSAGVSVYPGASATITDFFLPTNADSQMMTVSEFSFGFPFRSMTYALLDVHQQISPNPPTPKAIADAIDPINRARGSRTPIQLDVVTGNKNFKSPWFVPIRPIWSGLLIDSAIYGAFVAVAGYGWSRTRTVITQRLRRYHGLCEGCAYDLRGLEICPECKRSRFKAFSPSSHSSPA